MSLAPRIALIGNSLPRRCGIATFTTDLQTALDQLPGQPDTCIAAMCDAGPRHDYPKTVAIEIAEDRLKDYVRAAERINAEGWDVVCLQHEFGIFGGEAGANVLTLIDRLDAPLVTTLHTVLAEPNAAQATVMRAVIARSSFVVVMAEKGRSLLQSVYQAPPHKIRVVPHGIPDYPFVAPDAAKAQLGFAGRTVILTFGLLSPGKGIEVMIDAMPHILSSCPDAVYVVLGVTHPRLVEAHGEAYREELQARAADLGVSDHVVFLDAFVEQEKLLEFISSCDIYVTPYLNAAQMTSGTLAYSYGLGKVVVSTPYWHARELLADGAGVLVPFGDAAVLGAEIAGLLSDPERCLQMRQSAYDASRSMTWARTADAYMAIFEDAIADRAPARRRPAPLAPPQRQLPDFPRFEDSYFASLCDDTGLFQHAVHSVADRRHGYCVDDNARALLVSCALGAVAGQKLPEPMTGRFAAFIQHAWNPDIGRFRNFMSFERRWLEDRGSEDSHGRTLWSLGVCTATDTSPARRIWAAGLFRDAVGSVVSFTSPRAWAFTLLGLDGYCATYPADSEMRGLRITLARRLSRCLVIHATSDWTWFEGGLSYDNPRLCQALIETGRACHQPLMVEQGLSSLRWLTAIQTSSHGLFRPVGSDSFGDHRRAPRPFDQQPLEAAAAISAALAAWRVDGDPAWQREIERAFAWFTGSNDLGLALVDIDTGSCRDGLHPDRRNENRGGESAVSYLLALAEVHLARRELALSPRRLGALPAHA